MAMTLWAFPVRLVQKMRYVYWSSSNSSHCIGSPGDVFWSFGILITTNRHGRSQPKGWYMQLLNSKGLRFLGLYHVFGSKGDLALLLAIIKSKPSSIQAATLSKLKNSSSRGKKTWLTHPGKWDLIFFISAAASSPPKVLPLGSLPMRCSLVSSIKQSLGRYAFFPLCWGLYPLQAPCWFP